MKITKRNFMNFMKLNLTFILHVIGKMAKIYVEESWKVSVYFDPTIELSNLEIFNLIFQLHFPTTCHPFFEYLGLEIGESTCLDRLLTLSNATSSNLCL